MSMIPTKLDEAHSFQINPTDLFPNVSEEFNQYSNYFLQLIRADSIGNILIVDDDSTCASFIQDVAQNFSLKLRCFSASSEAEALQILKFVHCDLVIADYYLEGVETGLDLCRKIKILYPEITCLMISCIDPESYQGMAFDSEVQPEFMQKPLTSDSIQHYLASYFEK
jgi:response regulator of citrate/malate metabolism